MNQEILYQENDVERAIAHAQGVLKAHEKLTEEKLDQSLKISMDQRWYEIISKFEFPRDKKKIASLSLEDKQWWWFNAHKTGFTDSDTKEFEKFWKWNYLWIVRCRRLLLFILKPSLLIRRYNQKDDKAKQDLVERIKERNLKRK